MKRILIFSLAYYPQVGGAEVAIKEITSRISREDISFDLITLRFDAASPREEQVGSVHVYRVGGGGSYLSKVFFPLTTAMRAYRLQKENKYDAYWAMMSYMLFPIVLLRMVGVRVPYALTLQEGDPFDFVFNRMSIRPLLPLLHSGFKHATVVQVISNFLASWPRRLGFKGEVVMIPNGANPGDFDVQYKPEQLQAIKTRLGKKEGDVYLVTTSRLVHKNALDVVIRALTLLPPNIFFIIVGEGPDESKLRELAHTLGVEKRVVFVGQVDRTQTPLYRKVSDIFVRPSRSEGMGNSFVGAFASGLPVIATQEGGITDFLFDQKINPEHQPTGWAVDKENPEQIAQAVKDILENPQKAKEVTANARALALKSYNWDTIAKDMREKVFGKVLNNP